ncbi:Signal peptidase I [uncultured Desulfobacterium sp.]|uniref:Signal peptidase I n=1 Tax=uncultured Desulfobacterium sp. TaxID=201089 RepID=A0A445MX03_9BACT|nr:Signal peptidase I [uncultured Desulfobacterium sp.]
MKTAIPTNKIKKKSALREYVEAAAIAIILALFIRTFIIQAFKIPSGSMIPTLLVGDHILVNKFVYGVKIPFINKTIIPVSSPKREDVIVFIYPVDKSKDFIKRVIGLPGETLEMIDTKIFIDGKPYDDKYGVYSEPDEQRRLIPGKSNFGPLKVPDGHLFVMGDNRDNSHDSRFWGFVPLPSVKGKALIIYWSWPNLNRFLHVIH